MPDGATTPDLRERLGTLTLRDEHRLARRVDRLRHTKDDEARARELAKLLPEIERAEARIAGRRAVVPAVSYPEQLPVSARREDLLAAIRDHQVVVVAGETGSGKTTQLPKICLELGRGVRGTIAHTQPRRIAARTVAERIADELSVPLGEAVGYSVRFNDRAGENTLVRLMTDGLLLAEIQRDRLLRRYDTIIIDEAHERSLNIDFLLGCVKQILPRRPELKVVITSATIDPERFSAHFDDAPIVEVSGRTFPVEVRYRPIEDLDADSDDPDDQDRRRPAGRPGPRAAGRTGADRDQADAIGDAVEELLSDHARDAGGGDGDILVFLSGEREIRDTAEALSGRFRGARQSIEILPLYARLAASEQQRVFRRDRGGGRRVVLATNVAETSLTVPGIKYVIDPGTARISRYSSRLKVQRLPIERISQASANQRKGRCGRTSDGVCIRLYSEEDFEGRDEFTDPEILRTNLASVILQMAALELGAIEDFPFLEPPDGRQIRDGVLLLEELGALAVDGEERADAAGAATRRGSRLTPIGRKLAGLPVDPRMARMVLEADRLGCTDEVIVIAAALSIQDPRERPQEEQGSADQAHARFKDPRSDFLAYLHLWRYLREQQRALSGNQFRKRTKNEYLHYLRIREWQDLVAQLRQAAKQVGITVPRDARAEERLGEGDPEDRIAAADAERIHVALLSGLLSHIGLKDVKEPAGKGRPKPPKGRPPRPEFIGARNARFQLFPGSALAKRPPAWVMVSELVETSRLFGRTAARIEPGWIEPLAEHLIKRTYAEPRWDRKRGSVVATERAILYGLPVVAGRTVQYGRLDPAVSREIFLRSALVEGDWDGGRAGGAEILAENARRIAEVEAIEERARRRDLLVEDEVLFDFFDQRVPPAVVGGVEFDRWWRDERERRPDLLVYPRELLIHEQAQPEGDLTDARLRPTAWKQGDITLRLSYRFEPGSEHDGVTAHVPLKVLPQLQPIGFEWLVPGFRRELVTTLLRLLPKEVRRELVPIPETVERILQRMTPRSAPLPVALARELNAGPWHPPTQVRPAMLDVGKLPGHLRMSFRVEDDEQDPPALIAEGHDLAQLRAQVQPKLRAALAAATPSIERHGLRDWTIGALPRSIALPGTGDTIRAYPTLVDEGDSVGVRVLDTPAAQAEAMWRGTRRLLLLTVPSPARQLPKGLDARTQLILATAPHGSVDALLEDVVVGTVDGLLRFAGGPVWDAAAFAALRADVAARLPGAAPKVLQQVVLIVDAERDVRRRLEDLSLQPATEAAFGPALRDVEAQLRRLVRPGFVTDSGPRRLPDVLRYVQGAARRLERLPDTVAQDRDRMSAIHELERAYRERVESWPAGTPRPPALAEIPWMIEELRLTHFAQGFAGGRGGPVSAKRIRRALDELPRPGA
ncbi:ATP-dependent helicase hrpA [Patulibacter medicamentivorans]|uniref:ATP-dependent helicase hrpA n=1 Tax=Patulibacter medicamentivorans TaxID=1097667 RepID=H0E8M5_9ACTN|nr:ATP-dependent RNA helicase HrpA [Patulibacter medicamentivorans]EHN10025.1 ATP-dependent helicase hrpA [Patulibacter medicamentivorans]